MKSLLDPSFRYTTSFDTDLKRTFARIRGEPHQATTEPLAEAVRVPGSQRGRPGATDVNVVLVHGRCRKRRSPLSDVSPSAEDGALDLSGTSRGRRSA